MFVPLHDSTPLKVIRFQAVTILIIALNVMMYLTTGAFNAEAVLDQIASGYGVVPAELTHSAAPILNYDPIAEPLTLVSYMFLHASWWHLISNMLFLWVFADNIEDAYGHAAFAFLYLMSGVVAALFYVMLAPASRIPLVGASGAVSGILGAYVVLFPQARVWILLFMRIPIRIGALWVLGGWFLLQIISWWMDRADPEAGIAWTAHIGGFVAGAGLTYAIRRRLWMRLEA
ncbi:rhomboid family intramembrane serine protease [Aestuariivirga sp.]|uniref:rhomboid family intramembrane serine protease n=1 Tax=Aestuariivirga sp. TaxID=2650926 RepID=UPI0030198070